MSRNKQESEHTMTNAEIATTIANQMGGTGRLGMMIGANNFAADGPALQFKFKAGRKHNFCKVTLGGDDLYTVEISKVTKKRNRWEFATSNVVKHEGVYCDQLINLFEAATGLYLTL